MHKDDLSTFFQLQLSVHFFFLMVDSLGCVQTDATTPNIVGCYILRPFAQPVACCCAKFGANNSQYFCCFMIAEA